VTMPGLDLAAFGLLLAAAVATVVVVFAVTLVVARATGRHSVVDVTWGVGFVVVAVWGLRLALYIGLRNRGKGEDPRYVEMLGRAEGNPTWVAIRKVYLLQGLSIWFVSLPIQVSAAAGDSVLAVALLGVALWLLGVVFESVGDAQLRRFKADSGNRGRVMDQGLWAWTRHPNYFGDAAVWWGLYLVAASAWPGVLTVLSPVVMTYFLVFATGARLLEKEMAKRPGYPAYQERTSYFLPRPPTRA
jgi:steroid 5-alpha reductase family enzyme